VSTRAFLLPLKPFTHAKSRLRVAGASDVDAIAYDLAMGVINELREAQVFIVSDDEAITTFAHEQHLAVITSPSPGLNESVQFAYGALDEKYDVVVVVHGDLRHPTGLKDFVPDDGVTIVTDVHERGTNILSLPTKTDFVFHYGEDSRQAHEAEAARLGLTCSVLVNSPWAFDVDELSDLTSE